MSAAAPVFNPAKPLPSTQAGGDDLEADDGAESSTANGNVEAIAAAVAKSRVTRPLPNSRRLAPGADFVPKQATVPKSAEQKENTRRLIVVLSQVGLLTLSTSKICQN
jgi:rRNA small subunit pseudouridine methyltransferase Nep1